MFLESSGIHNNGSGNEESQGLLRNIIGQMGDLAAFVNPSLTKENTVLNRIVQACDTMNLPAPLKAVTAVLKQHTHGKKIDELSHEDIRRMGISVLKNGPPALIDRALKTNSLTEYELQQIGSGGSGTMSHTESKTGFGGLLNNPFIKGIVSFASE